MNNNILTFQQNDSLLNHHKQPIQQPSSNKTYYICFMLYFLQGNVISIGMTMPYLYPDLPSYATLALFSTIDLPFSFKFFFSPFLQKYTHLSYGKRKFWIIISQFLCSICLFTSSFFTEVHQASVLAIMLLISQFFITIQDISLDSLSIKQLRCPQKTSSVQSVAQTFGTVLGSLFLLKFTSVEFAKKIGLQSGITTPQMMIKFIAATLILSAIFMHLVFKQTYLECEQKGKQKSISEIVGYSKTFFIYKSRYCRTALFFLIYYQGMKFYQAGYDYELIKAGFSRDTSNSISNLITLPILVLTFYMGGWISKLGVKKSLISGLSCLCLFYSLMIWIFPLSTYVIVATQFISSTLITFKNMVLYMIINNFPFHALSGMFTTIFLSVWNLGELKTVNTLIINQIGWRNSAVIGLLIQIIIITQLSKIFKWIQSGQVCIDSTILHHERPIDVQNQTVISSMTIPTFPHIPPVLSAYLQINQLSTEAGQEFQTVPLIMSF